MFDLLVMAINDVMLCQAKVSRLQGYGYIDGALYTYSNNALLQIIITPEFNAGKLSKFQTESLSRMPTAKSGIEPVK